MVFLALRKGTQKLIGFKEFCSKKAMRLFAAENITSND